MVGLQHDLETQLQQKVHGQVGAQASITQQGLHFVSFNYGEHTVLYIVHTLLMTRARQCYIGTANRRTRREWPRLLAMERPPFSARSSEVVHAGTMLLSLVHSGSHSALSEAQRSNIDFRHIWKDAATRDLIVLSVALTFYLSHIGSTLSPTC